MYYKKLQDEGIESGRSFALQSAMDALHTAMSKLDSKNLAIWQSKSLNERMVEFAEAEDLRII